MATHTKESIQSLLDRSPAAVERALVVLFERQTRDEQASSDTHHYNTVGFTAFHARSGSKYAKWVLAGLRDGKPLGRCIMSQWHQDKARGIVKHYWRQLIQAADDKEERRAIVAEGCRHEVNSMADFRTRCHLGVVRV